MVFRLLLGTTLRLLKLMNSGEMSSNCRLFFIFLQSFSTKIFKAVFPQLLCNTSNHRSVEYAENAPNKYYCHRPSARKYETVASFTQSDVNADSPLHSFFEPESKRGGLMQQASSTKRVSRENTSIRKLTTENAATYVDCCLLKFYSELGQLYSSQSEKGERANGSSFLPEPGSDGLKQGRVMQHITFGSTARLRGRMIHVEWASPEP